jgi:hypothetical protein
LTAFNVQFAKILASLQSFSRCNSSMNSHLLACGSQKPENIHLALAHAAYTLPAAFSVAVLLELALHAMSMDGDYLIETFAALFNFF